MNCYVCGKPPAPIHSVVTGPDGNPVIKTEIGHAYVGVGRETPNLSAVIEAGQAAGTDAAGIAALVEAEIKAKAGLVGHPICAACQASPKPGFKLHYFKAKDAPKALRMAGGPLGVETIAAESVALAPGSA
jgi:hypothetical protein